MNTRDLEYLVAVAEELNFGRAAERCHASQSALSGQLRKLEAQLGVRVFERTKRYVRLTEVGAQILDQARSILHQVEELERLALANKNPFAGKCVLGMPPTIGPFLTPLLLPAVKKNLPELRLDLIEDFTDKLEDRLVAGDLDIAILATSPTHSILSEVLLYDEPFWVAMPNNHPLAKHDTVSIDKIEPGELLLLSDGHCLRDQIYEVFRSKIADSPDDRRPKTQKTSLSTILSLVASGSGITLVPAMSVGDGDVNATDISVRREQSGTAGRTVRLTYRKGYHRKILIDALQEIITKVLPDSVRPTRR